MTQTLGLYLSVPFCRAKCTFCNFASDSFPPARMEAYVEQLCRQLATARSFAEERGLALPVWCDSVFLGGGTPSLLTPQQFERVFRTAREFFLIDREAEVTCEAAPGQIAGDLLEAMQRCGVNRVSLGVQSFQLAETRAVGRLHTPEQCLAEIGRLRSAGFRSISLDLILGLPHQTRDSWQSTLDVAVDSGVDHISVYMLEIDEGSRLGREALGREQPRRDALMPVLPDVDRARYSAGQLPEEQVVAELYLHTLPQLAAAGFAQYEISNFARIGHHSRHNRKYWERAPYLGCGLDAHSMLHQSDSAVRFAETSELESYLAEPAWSATALTPVSDDEAFEEAVFLGLRLNEGISLSQLERAFGRARVETLAQAAEAPVEAELLRRDGRQLALTDRGRLVSSTVFSELLAEPATVR